SEGYAYPVLCGNFGSEGYAYLVLCGNFGSDGYAYPVLCGSLDRRASIGIRAIGYREVVIFRLMGYPISKDPEKEPIEEEPLEEPKEEG
ncbi:hypothetical protein Tco_0805135, partial [Tanacetum coccineum]